MSGAGSALVPREITIPTGSVSLGSSVCAFIYGSDSARVFRGTSRAGAGDENGSPPCARPLSHHFSRVLSTLGATTRARPEEPTAQWFRKPESRPRRPACIASTRLFQTTCVSTTVARSCQFLPRQEHLTAAIPFERDAPAAITVFEFLNRWSGAASVGRLHEMNP